jgi:hypothetical protein
MSLLLRILRNAIPERPIFFFYFNQVDEDIFPPDIELSMKSLGDDLVE